MEERNPSIITSHDGGIKKRARYFVLRHWCERITITGRFDFKSTSCTVLPKKKS